MPIVSTSLLFNSRLRGNEGQQPTSRTAILLLSDILEELFVIGSIKID